MFKPEIVKFIMTDEKIYYGKADDVLHGDVIHRYSIPVKSIRGGGKADLANYRIFGTSRFGAYNPKQMRSFLISWRIDPPSDGLQNPR